MYSKMLSLRFPEKIVNEPIAVNLVKKFDLSFNILKAEISPRHEGTMTLEISGLEEDYEKGIHYLKESGVRITPVAQRIVDDEDGCVHCGLCTAICPTGALYVRNVTRKVDFLVDKCSACGMCTRICPVRAMRVELDDDERTG